MKCSPASLHCVLTLTFFITGCATSMTPSQFNERLPKATNSRFIDRMAANKVILSKECHLLVGGRKYVSPIGFTVDGDLRNGAQGIDEWVKSDDGNAYSVSNFEWMSIGENGVTQLIVYFDTMRCD